MVIVSSFSGSFYSNIQAEAPEHRLRAASSQRYKRSEETFSQVSLPGGSGASSERNGNETAVRIEDPGSPDSSISVISF
jgi:hypothetical protein